MESIKHKTKTELAVEGIRNAILLGELDDGAQLTLATLQRSLGMSTSPIREALRVLEAEGLVILEPHQGVRVASLTLEGVAELYMLRAPLEKLAGRLAAANITDEQLAQLESVQELFSRAAAQEDDEAATRRNAGFHSIIYGATNTRYLERLIIGLWVPYTWGSNWVLTGRQEAVREHGAILAALRDRDVDQAGDLLEAHTLRVHSILLDEIERASAGLVPLPQVSTERQRLAQ